MSDPAEMTKYRIRANGYLVIPVLAAIYVVGSIVYLRLLIDPSVPAAENIDASIEFLHTYGLLFVCILPYMLVMMAVDATLSRPVDFLVIALLGGGMMLTLYAFYLWAKPHVVVT